MIQWNHAKCCGADPFCHGNDIWARRGDLVAYRFVCMSVCMSVCHAATSNRFFFFVSRWNRAIFWPSFLHVALYKTFSSISDLGPLTSKIYSPKSPISRLVRQIDRICLGVLWGFRGWPIQWNHVKFCGPTLVAMATTFGLSAEIYI